MARCEATTSAGYTCINKAKAGRFCPAHDPRNWCGRPTGSGGRCKRRAKANGGPCTKHARS